MEDLVHTIIERFVEEAIGVKMSCPLGGEFDFVNNLSPYMMEQKDSVTHNKLSVALAGLFIGANEVAFARKLLDQYGWSIRDERKQDSLFFLMDIIKDHSKYVEFCFKSPLMACILTDPNPEKFALAEEIIGKKKLDPWRNTSADMTLAFFACKKRGYTHLAEVLKEKLPKELTN